MNANSPLDWWHPKSQHAVLTALGQLDEALDDVLMLAKAVAEQRRQEKLGEAYRHAAEQARVTDSIRTFRESYRRRAS